MEIHGIRVTTKEGGKSGSWQAKAEQALQNQKNEG
jgi:cyclic pyranopterin phosphate synthase